jgi:hypothetical protein
MFRLLCTTGAVVLMALTGSPVPVLEAQSTPTAAMKAYHEAARKKDAGALKGLLSAALLKELAKAPVPFESMMEPIFADAPPIMPETRNEKIAGDHATLEVRDHKSARWEPVHFVRENGVWKIALEKEP